MGGDHIVERPEQETRQDAVVLARRRRNRELRAGERHEKVRVFNSNTLLGFGQEHADAGRAVRELNRTLRSATWSKMQDVRESYPSATVLNAERVVFQVKGNDYRTIIAFDFPRHAAFIKFVGTHAEYDRIDALTIGLYSRGE